MPKKRTQAEIVVGAMLDRQKRLGEIVSYEFEGVILKIGDNCRYLADYTVFLPDGRLRLVEAKGGHIWEDSIIKFKCAKKQYPLIEFELWQCKKGELSRLL